MKTIPIWPALLLCMPVGAQAQAVSDQRARWERGQAEDHRYRQRSFAEAGFSLIEDEAPRRQVRRLLLRDPYMILPVPGVEVERHADRRVTLRLQYRGWSSEPIAIDSRAWAQLAAIERSAFARPLYVPWPVVTGPPPPPPPVCHGWIAIIQAGDGRTASWAACGGREDATLRYAARIAELALGARPGCTRQGNDVFWAFNGCFAPSRSLDDPVLEATYATLRNEYDAAPGAERLAEARRALRVPSLALGSPAWREARAAIARFREVHHYRHERLRRLMQLASGAVNASPADRIRMRQAIENWTSFLQAQEANYADLLERLLPAGN